MAEKAEIKAIIKSAYISLIDNPEDESIREYIEVKLDLLADRLADAIILAVGSS